MSLTWLKLRSSGSCGVLTWSSKVFAPFFWLRVQIRQGFKGVSVGEDGSWNFLARSLHSHPASSISSSSGPSETCRTGISGPNTGRSHFPNEHEGCSWDTTGLWFFSWACGTLWLVRSLTATVMVPDLQSAGGFVHCFPMLSNRVVKSLGHRLGFKSQKYDLGQVAQPL